VDNNYLDLGMSKSGFIHTLLSGRLSRWCLTPVSTYPVPCFSDESTRYQVITVPASVSLYHPQISNQNESCSNDLL
jgi:hypothetical protein